MSNMNKLSQSDQYKESSISPWDVTAEDLGADGREKPIGEQLEAAGVSADILNSRALREILDSGVASLEVGKDGGSLSLIGNKIVTENVKGNQLIDGKFEDYIIASKANYRIYRKDDGGVLVETKNRNYFSGAVYDSRGRIEHNGKSVSYGVDESVAEYDASGQMVSLATRDRRPIDLRYGREGENIARYRSEEEAVLRGNNLNDENTLLWHDADYSPVTEYIYLQRHADDPNSMSVKWWHDGKKYIADSIPIDNRPGKNEDLFFEGSGRITTYESSFRLEGRLVQSLTE